MKNKKSLSSRSESINRYQMLVELANDIICETDTQGFFTYINPKAVEVVGYSKTEVIGKKYIDLVRPDYKERVTSFYQNQVIQAKPTTYLEFPVICADGRELWVGQNVQIINDHEGVLGMMSIARDITDRYFAEQQLSRSEEKYRGIIQNIQFGLIEVDLDERILNINEAMCAITGYAADELLGKVASDILGPKRTKDIVYEEHKKRENGIASAYEVELTHKEGFPQWCLVSGAPRYNANGERIGSIGIHMNITTKKKDEEELVFNRNRLLKYKKGLEMLNEMASNIDFGFNNQIMEGMKISANYLDLPLGLVSRVEGDQYYVQHSYNVDNGEDTAEQTQLDLCETYCDICYGQGSKLAISNCGNSEYSNHIAYKKQKFETYIAAPYTVNGKKRGTVSFFCLEVRPNPFDEYDLEFIDLVAKYIGFITSQSENKVALSNERENLRLRNIELDESQLYLRVINNFVTKLLVIEDIEQIAWEIAENVVDKFGFEDCVVYVWNEEKNCFEQLAKYNQSTPHRSIITDPIKIKFGEGLVGAVALTGVAEIINDTTQDSRYLAIDFDGLSEIIVPIISEGKVIGIIDSEHSKQHFFAEKHLSTLTTLANLASKWLKNAKGKRRQMKAEAELIESEFKLRNVINSALDGIITIDQQGLVTEWNPQAEAIFGWNRKETIGKPLTSNIIPNNHHAAHNSGMHRYLDTGEHTLLNQRFEINAKNKNGEEFPVELAIIPLVHEGVHSFTAFARDITLERQSRNEMQKALEKEKELNELKSRFVSITSHEFRTPLTTIKINTDLIAFKLENQLPEQFDDYREHLIRIESEVNRVTRLMNDVLMLGKVESGKIKINKRLVDLNKLVHKLIKEFVVGRKDGRSIELTIIGTVRKVNIDVELFSYVLNNLVSNALKYSEGSVNPEIMLSYAVDTDIKIAVKDYGIGIPEKDQNDLFEFFYRGSNVKNINGSGLGLSIVKEFVELLGGIISLQSDLNQGTEFTVVFPSK